MLKAVETKSPPGNVGPPSVFVIDDDREQSFEMADFLRSKGHSVTEIHDGLTAVVEIEKAAPAIAIMDVRMPFCDGVRAAELLSFLSPQTAVILMSGFSDEVDRAQRANCGAVAILAKPVSLRIISGIVSSFTRG